MESGKAFYFFFGLTISILICSPNLFSEEIIPMPSTATSVPVETKYEVELPDDGSVTEDLRHKKLLDLKQRAYNENVRKCVAQGGRIETSRVFSSSKNGVELAPTKGEVHEQGQRTSSPKSKITLYVHYVFNCWIGVESSIESFKIKDASSNRAIVVKLYKGHEGVPVR